jgi:hypothetical protein
MSQNVERMLTGARGSRRTGGQPRHDVLELRSALTCRDLEDGSGSQAATSPRVVLARFRFLV